LGVVADATYTCQSTVLEVGDRLVLYTDGLIERRGENLTESIERLCATVPQHTDAAGTCRHMLETLSVDADRPDDICVLTLRRTG
jgi:serine phosphatase RsbU (regulator of sigma subunit)